MLAYLHLALWPYCGQLASSTSLELPRVIAIGCSNVSLSCWTLEWQRLCARFSFVFPTNSSIWSSLIRSWFAKVVLMSDRSPDQTHDQIRELLDSLYRVDSGRILATLIRLLGDFDLAEAAMHESFAAELSLWTGSGVPDNP